MPDKVSVIIPGYGHKDLTAKCLLSLPDTIQVIIIDDDRGYPETANRGLSIATGDYLVISNNDIEFIQSDWIDHLLKPLKEGFGISSIRTTEPDGWQTEDKITENDKFGSLWAMTRATYEQLGPLDERFGRGYGEDLDYWHRAREAGIKIAKNHAGLAEHKGKATFSQLEGSEDRSFQDFVPVYKRKWGDKAHLILTDEKTIVLLTDPELADMGDTAKRYLDREVSIEQVNERFNASW